MTQDTLIKNSQVMGALFDFAAWLTTQPGALTLGAAHDAAPVADALKEFGRVRGISTDVVDVEHWHDRDPIGALEECIDAFRQTREYVGEDLLPDQPGWAHFDAVERAKAEVEGR